MPRMALHRRHDHRGRDGRHGSWHGPELRAYFDAFAAPADLTSSPLS